jgi:hypothetical protein
VGIRENLVKTSPHLISCASGANVRGFPDNTGLRQIAPTSPMRRPSPRPAPRVPLLIAIVLLALAGCSPRYDWRTIVSNEGQYAALYPDKPTSAARDVAIAGRQLPMRMEAARIDNTLFAVGVVSLPADDAGLRREALASMQAGLVGNLGAHPDSPARSRPVTVMSAGQPPVALDGVEVTVAGISPQDKSPRRLTARLVASGSRVYQAVVLEAGDAAKDARQAEQVEQFLTGFHPF